MKVKNTYKTFVSVFVLASVCLVSCLEDHSDTVRLENEEENLGNDIYATMNPDIGSSNASIPYVNYSIENKDGNPEDVTVRLDMTGIQSSGTKEWLRLIGTDEPGTNVWISIDCRPKYVTVYNTIDDVDQNVVVKNDLVFLVDNSGTMSEESNVIARDLMSWAKSLTANFDIKFGCVGYDGLITGALNLTSYNDLNRYLSRNVGTDRTVGFSGPDASTLQSKTYNYDLISQEECPMAALRYADNYFSFRNDANRIYVNFTDEYNQPQGYSSFSVRYLTSQSNWPTTKGTIHTVYSGSTTSSETTNYEEKPWRMSEYTGGTIIYTNSNFSGVTLDNLPITEAIRNSYIIRFSNITQFMDGKYHELKITIYDENQSIRAEKKFSVNFGK